jgi:hypothetical protein
MFFICVHRCASVAKTVSVPHCVEVLITAETRKARRAALATDGAPICTDQE